MSGERSRPATIRVAVVDDHPLAHMGMRHFISAHDDLELVGTAGSGEEAIEMCARTQPDVVMMDVKMSGMDGLSATRLLKSRFPRLRVLILTSHHDGSLVDQAMRAGAAGFLLKTAMPLEMVQAIRSAYAGRAAMAPEATEALVELLRQQETLQGARLSVREQEVLQLLAQGRSNLDIADQLRISQATVKFHIRGIFAKLGVTTRSEAIVLAYRQGLVA